MLNKILLKRDFDSSSVLHVDVAEPEYDTVLESVDLVVTPHRGMFVDTVVRNVYKSHVLDLVLS